MVLMAISFAEHCAHSYTQRRFTLAFVSQAASDWFGICRMLHIMEAAVVRRWLRHMPEEVKGAGGHGQVCCLFWPPPGGQSAEMTYSTYGWLDWWHRSAFAKSLNLLVQV
jgi:hypothetical protein